MPRAKIPNEPTGRGPTELSDLVSSEGPRGRGRGAGLGRAPEERSTPKGTICPDINRAPTLPAIMKGGDTTIPPKGDLLGPPNQHRKEFSSFSTRYHCGPPFGGGNRWLFHGKFHHLNRGRGRFLEIHKGKTAPFFPRPPKNGPPLGGPIHGTTKKIIARAIRKGQTVGFSCRNRRLSLL